MPFQVSPGVNVSEIDLTTVVPGVATSTGGFVGRFNWGPVSKLTQVTSETRLVELFGKPNGNTALSFFPAANFLAYGNDLRLVRAANATTTNCATANASANIVVKNDEDYFNNYYTSGSINGAPWTARYPGALGNSLKVEVFANSNTTLFSSWAYAPYFDGAPGTSDYAADKGSANDELHIVVVDEDGAFTGVANTVLEKYAYLSKDSEGKKEDGSSNYYKEVIYRNSKYVYWMGHVDSSNTAATWGTSAPSTTYVQITYNSGKISHSLVNGTDGAAPSAAELQTGWDLFKTAEVDVSLLFTGAQNGTVAKYAVDNVAEYRKDCVVFISPELADAQDSTDPVAAEVAFRTTDLANLSSSYAFLDSGWKYQYDKYNDIYRWIPLNADIAGLCVRTDYERDAWFSPAGVNRGNIKNVVKLAFNPNKTQRDTLYKNGINAVISESGTGTVLWGDKTLLSKPSAFDRINVRRLFIVLEKAIARAAKSSLFEFNDEFTRSQFVALVEPFLRDIQGRRGIYDFRVVCDESNNTGEVIDRNEFVGDIYVKPARSINYIQLNFVAVRTGVAFEEVVGKF